MKALTIKSPWASLIIHGSKDIENRKWPTRLRERIAIHSSAKKDLMEGMAALELYAKVRGRPLQGLPEFQQWSRWCNDTGMVLGTIEIVDCVRRSDSPWFFGTYGFVLRNPRPLAVPIPILGKLGLWDLPMNIQAQIAGELGDHL